MVTLGHIVSGVRMVTKCHYYELVSNKGRSTQKVSITKQLICYFWDKYKPCHNREVWQLLNYTNHTRIFTNIKLVNAIISVDKSLKEDVDKIDSLIENLSKSEATELTLAMSTLLDDVNVK